MLFSNKLILLIIIIVIDCEVQNQIPILIFKV